MKAAKITSIWVVCMLASVLVFGQAQAVVLSVGDGGGTLNDEVQVSVTVDNPLPIAGAAFTVTYDTTGLELVSATGSFFDSMVKGDEIPGTGTMLSGATPQTGSSDATLFNLNFRIKDTATGDYAITLAQSTISNTSAGYPSGGEAIQMLTGANPSEPNLPDAYPVVSATVDGGLLSVDRDGDGLSDTAEDTIYNTNPDVKDSDGDGMEDGAEVAYWAGRPETSWDADPDGDTLVNLLDPDSDGDGSNDGDEVAAGTDPIDEESYPGSSGVMDQLAADFGGDGLWHYSGVSGWAQLDTADPLEVVAANVDSDGAKELVASYATGVYVYDNVPDGPPEPITVSIPEAMMPWENTVAMDFGPEGLQTYDKFNGWVILNAIDPGAMTCSDLDGDDEDELVAAFPGHGTYVFDNGLWTRLTTWIAEDMVPLRGSSQDRLGVDFGIGKGVYLYDVATGWLGINAEDPDMLTAADPDGDGEEELVVWFSAFGLYVYDNAVWTKINTVAPESMFGLQNGKLVVDFGESYGLFTYDSTATWTELRGLDPVAMTGFDPDGDGTIGLAAGFASLGVEAWEAASSWSNLDAKIPDALVGYGNEPDIPVVPLIPDTLVVNFGSDHGLQLYNEGLDWKKINVVEPTMATAVDVDEDGSQEVIACFNGYQGIYEYDDEAWTEIRAETPLSMIRLDRVTLLANFGAGVGLETYTEADGWSSLIVEEASLTVSADLNGDGEEELVVSFPSYGLYYYDGTWHFINSVEPESVVPLSGGRLIVDFGSAYGLYQWDRFGGWLRLSKIDPQQICAIDLDGDQEDEFAVTFNGYGLYTCDDGTWVRLNTIVPEAIMGRTCGKLAADYGTVYGLYHWSVAESWKQLSQADPDSATGLGSFMCETDVDDDGECELVVSFPGYGLYVWNDQTGKWTMITNVAPKSIFGADRN